MDPIAELLSQLSGVRRSAGGQLNSSGPSASQLQQLQMQLQLERQHAQAARQQLRLHATQPGVLTQAVSPLQSHNPQQQPTQLTQKAVSKLSRIPSFF